MGREKIRKLILIIALIFMSIGCSFNAVDNGSISISLPRSEFFGNGNNEGACLEERPETYRVQITCADGSKEDCKAWAQIPTGYVGIDDAVQALSSGSGELTVKAFVDDTTELETVSFSLIQN